MNSESRWNPLRLTISRPCRDLIDYASSIPLSSEPRDAAGNMAEDGVVMTSASRFADTQLRPSLRALSTGYQIEILLSALLKLYLLLSFTWPNKRPRRTWREEDALAHRLNRVTIQKYTQYCALQCVLAP
jgi:hypothetical protein